LAKFACAEKRLVIRRGEGERRESKERGELKGEEKREKENIKRN
jgi:hypothetical protein